MTINGALTLGENIGDLGGLTIAYEAYQMHVRAVDGGKAPVIDGFSGDQRFFLAWAQLWRDYTTPAHGAAEPADRSAQPRRVPRQRIGAQLRPLVRGLRRRAKATGCTWHPGSGCGSGEPQSQPGVFDHWEEST